jgi:hypothetical protein
MRGIANGTQVTGTMPAAAAASGTPGWLNNAAPGPGVTPTQLWPDDLNITLAELLGLVAAGGLTPDTTGANVSQITGAVRNIAADNYTWLAASGSTTPTLTVNNAGLIELDATAGNMTVTLPAANSFASRPIRYRFLQIDTSGNTVTIVPAGTSRFFPGGAASYLLTPLVKFETETDSTNWIIAPGAFGNNVAVITATGSWTVPAGVTRVKVRAWSGGGGGSGCTSGSITGAGGAGGYGEKHITGLVPGATVSCTIGAGGAGGASGANAGSAGTATSFGSFVTITGGSGGSSASGGAGGVASGADLGITGGTGAGTLSTGPVGGFGGSAPAGGAGGVPSFNTMGASGNFPGGGGASGSGTASYAGGAGASGLIVVEY